MISLNDLVSPANGAIAALLRSPLHRVASGGLMILTWKGRQSGKEYSAPLGYQERGEQIIVLISKPSEKTWWKNFREPWPATLLVKRKQRPMTGTVVAPDEPEFFAHVERTLKRLPWMGSQFGGFKYDKTVGLTDEQRATLRDHVAVVVFT